MAKKMKDMKMPMERPSEEEFGEELDYMELGEEEGEEEMPEEDLDPVGEILSMYDPEDIRNAASQLEEEEGGEEDDMEMPEEDEEMSEEF